MTLLVAGGLTPTNIELRRAFRARGIYARLGSLDRAERRLHAGDTLLARLDVRPTLDGIEPGLERLRQFERQGLTVLNPADALLAAHDKLATATRLAEAGVPHPETVHFGGREVPDLPLPLVIKPRFGSWGRDVCLCRTRSEVSEVLRRLRRRDWFRSQGAIAQEALPILGYDVRLVVAAGVVVGSIKRVAASGEWRTNISLGGVRQPHVPSEQEISVAVAASYAIGGDLVGVDLMPSASGYSVVELNGCVDFTFEYSLYGRDVFEHAVERLADVAALRRQLEFPRLVPEVGAQALVAVPPPILLPTQPF